MQINGICLEEGQKRASHCPKLQSYVGGVEAKIASGALTPTSEEPDR
jgi:hypothetical protein